LAQGFARTVRGVVASGTQPALSRGETAAPLLQTPIPLAEEAKMITKKSRLTTGGLILAATVLTACSQDTLTTPGFEEDPAFAFSDPISITELNQATASSTSRIEVDLISPFAPLVARELEVEEPTEITDEEKIESRVTAVRNEGTGATLVLELGALEITITPSTRLRAEGGLGSFDVAGFVSRVEDRLADGRQPPVEVKRIPPAVPQAPDDATFVATEVRFNDESGDPELELNVDGDNFDFAAASSGSGTLRVLGLEIILDAAGGRTRLEQEREDHEGKVDFEGLVLSVDVAAGSVMLAGGLEILLVEATEIDQGSSGDEHLRSLSAVADALAEGTPVEAEGEGVSESAGVILAVEIEFEVENDAEDVPGAAEFEGSVSAVDTVASSFTLADGRTMAVTLGTTFDPEGDLRSLTEMATAVDANRPVRAEGYAVHLQDGTWRVLETKVEVDD
jgi:hypothetical protein